jgi:Raf kinase inhibitor-like YbhB/YbcL family protein
MRLFSNAFKSLENIDAKYTCDGADISPPLEWDSVPTGTKSFALICDDPDAPVGNWDHWLLYNMPMSTTSIPENVRSLPVGTLVGRNSWGRDDYGGPCPPDRKHRYFFKLYALDKMLDIPSGANKDQLYKAMDGHILEQAELVGKYKRPGQPD